MGRAEPATAQLDQGEPGDLVVVAVGEREVGRLWLVELLAERRQLHSATPRPMPLTESFNA